MRFPVLRLSLLFLSLASVFFFPYPATLVLSFLASVAFPPTGLLTGVLSDLIYYVPPGAPVASIAGAIVSALGLLVRRFVKARIMTA